MDVAAAVADAHRREWAFVLAATVRVTRDIDVAEECVQDAYAQALRVWTEKGVPRKPAAWLTTVARHRALDLARRDARFRRAMPLLVADDVSPGADQVVDESPSTEGIADDRLRLICTCCHPALDRPSQLALTLRLVGGLTTAEVARAFLISEPTMAARITRAKKKIATARIPYRVPSVTELPERMTAVLAVVHLIFTTGHSAPSGRDLVRADLTEQALGLARMLHVLRPDDAEVTGLLALLVLSDVRRPARTSATGDLVLLADQDRSRWDRGAIDEGVRLVRSALRCGKPPGAYALQAAIAAVHAEAPSWDHTDWAEIVGLYDLLLQQWPSPVVALNRAAAIGFWRGPADGLEALDVLAGEPRLAAYPYLAAARAEFLAQLGRVADARLAYSEALLLTENDVERAHLTSRLDALRP